ncbi:hypothetical protein JXO59_14730 [candidate division KSB1 bacterium]|nr:hypothetical protein [candidate division KSB1 bacterium]
MKKVLALLAMMVSLFLLSLSANLAQDRSIKMNRVEIESMVYFFGEANVKGSDIEILATLSQKLKKGQKEASAFTDTTQTIQLDLTPGEAKICLDIINDATFQAKWVEMVYGMKRKLEKMASSTATR